MATRKFARDARLQVNNCNTNYLFTYIFCLHSLHPTKIYVQAAGMEWGLSDIPFQSLQEFVCKLYCSQPGTDNINELRCSVANLVRIGSLVGCLLLDKS